MGVLVPSNGMVQRNIGDGAGSLFSRAAVITDSAGGTEATSAAAGVGIYDITIPVTLPVGGTTAVDQLTTLVIGHRFQIISWSYIEAVATTGTNSTRPYNLEIQATDVGTSPSVLTITTASAAVGRVINGAAIAGAATGSATDSVSIEVAASGTTHDAGSGAFVLRIKNLDTCDFVASILAKMKTSGLMASA